MSTDLEAVPAAIPSPPTHPCVFVAAGSHHHPAFADFHAAGPTVLVEWLEDAAILIRGPRSYVCARYVAASVERDCVDFRLVS